MSSDEGRQHLQRFQLITAQSIDLTQLPAASSTSKSDPGSSSQPAVEYSSREVSPPALLIQQLVRAQSIFLLHHGQTLEQIFAKHDRTKFCNILEKYWSRFASTWDVLLHGSPAVDIYGGMKLAAGGELGMGVGEEEWGSSERDVLEDFARRTEGLVDVMVSRFGEASSLQQAKSSVDPKTLEVADTEPWLGSGKNVNSADGVVFSGLGAISRRSLRDVSHWVESIYHHGEYAYGVRDNPTSDRKKRRRKPPKPESGPSTLKVSDTTMNNKATPHMSDTPDSPIGIPPPIVKAVETSLDKASAAVASKSFSNPGPEEESKPMLASLGDTEMWMKYMTLGYGTAWGGKKTVAESTTPTPQAKPARTPSPEAMRYVEPEPDVDVAEEKLKTQIQSENDGYFLVGLKGDMLDLDVDDENDEGNWNNRIQLRTMHVEVERGEPALSPGFDSDATPQYEKELTIRSKETSNFSRLRPVVYVVSTSCAVLLCSLTTI